jgi:SAM-dependent methyltransferase
MVWDYHPLENLNAIYDETYFVNDNVKGGYANYVEGMSINRKTFFLRLKRFEQKLGKKGKVLDVGCALGDFLVEANKRNWPEVAGLEISDYGVNFAKKSGLVVKKGGLIDSLYPNNHWDLITYQDVIEHIKDPLKEVKLAYKALASGGYIFLVTPDVDGFWRKLLGRYWYHYKPQEHIRYFSQKSLELLLKKAGFGNIETRRTYHVLSIEYVVNRLRYYAPWFFELMLKMVRKTFLKNISFKLYVGEIEAWGRKNV